MTATRTIRGKATRNLWALKLPFIRRLLSDQVTAELELRVMAEGRDLVGPIRVTERWSESGYVVEASADTDLGTWS